MVTTSQRSVLDGHNDSLGSNREVSKGEAKGTGVFASGVALAKQQGREQKGSKRDGGFCFGNRR